MSDSPFSLVPVRPADLAVGKPLPYAIYDGRGKLLLAAGRPIISREQLEGLVDDGFRHDPTWDLEAKGGRVPSPPPPARKVPPPAQPVVDHAPQDEGKEEVVAMDDIRWQVGETLYLQQIDNPAVRHTVRLIGFMKNKTVFVTEPWVDGKGVFVRDGVTFVARAFSGKKAYAFVVSAMKTVLTPHPHLHLTYPKEVRCTIVRRGVRAPVKIAAGTMLGEPPRRETIVLTDLSIGGASGIHKQVLGKKGEEGRIEFTIDAAGEPEQLSLRTALRSVSPNENGEGYKHGFEFLDVPAHARLILSAYVHQILAEGQ